MLISERVARVWEAPRPLLQQSTSNGKEQELVSQLLGGRLEVKNLA